MVHEMKIQNESFERIAARKKTIELRLYDNKQRALDIGDSIIFTNLSNTKRRLATRITALYRYASFQELFEEIIPQRCGIDSSVSVETAIEQMRTFFTDEQVTQYGVVGIRIEIDDMETVEHEKAQIQATIIERLFPDGMK